MADFWKFSTILLALCLGLVFFGFFIKKMTQKWRRRYQTPYPSRYTCIDGHRVRSLAELLIDNWFYTQKVRHRYEDIIIHEGRKYKYDWYLEDYGLYIEFFGYSGKKYFETKREKEKFYAKHRLTMLAIAPENLADLHQFLKNKLQLKTLDLLDSLDLEPHAKYCPNCGEILQYR
jgi:hypothetical protein